MIGCKVTSFGVWFKPFLAVLAGPLLVKFVNGTMLGQLAVMLPHITQKGSDLGLSRDQAAWVGSISMMGTLMASCLSGRFADVYGRIRTSQVFFLLCGVGYALIAASTDFKLLMLGRFIIGLGNGFSFPSSIYSAEISPPKHRGLFLSLGNVFACLGHLYMYVCGCFITWHQTSSTVCISSIIGLILSLCLYESPQWLVQKGKIHSARESLEQMEPLADVEAKLKEFQDSVDDKQKRSISLKNFTEPNIWKPFFMTITITILQSGCGIYIMLCDPVTVIEKFPTAIHPFYLTVALGVVRLLTVVLSLYPLRKIGRRTIGIFSGFTTAISLLVILAWAYFVKIYPILSEYSWVFDCAFMAMVMVSTVGLYQLPWILPNEMFPTKVRGTMNSVNYFLLYGLIFVVLQFDHVMVAVLGVEGVVLVFAVCSLAFGVFSLFVLVETHGKTLHEIEQEFSKK